MPSYFPLPINFPLENKNTKVKSSITVFNYPNNFQINPNIESFKKDIYFCLYLRNKNSWLRLKEFECEYGNHINLKRDEFDIGQKDMAVIVASSQKDNPRETSHLPKPFSLRRDKSPIAERAAYNFKVGNSISSFQGEYPYRMALQNKGSLFTFDALRLDKSLDQECYLLLMNLNVDASVGTKNTISILNTKKTVQKTYSALSNNFTILKLPNQKFEENYNLNNSERLFIKCSSNTFVPIFINIGKINKNYQISVEHSHPPSEMLWGIEKSIILGKIKSKWI